MTMRSSAPASTGVATIRPFCGMRQAEVLGDLHAERAEDDPDHEGQVEIEEGRQQRRAYGRPAGMISCPCACSPEDPWGSGKVKIRGRFSA